MKTEKIARNIMLGNLAKEMVQLICDVMLESGLSKDEQYRVWEKICKEQCLITQKESSITGPMSYDDARWWYRKHRMEFGKHKGKCLIDVPIEYLEWLDSQPDFRVDLHRFLQSEYWKTTHGKE